MLEGTATGGERRRSPALPAASFDEQLATISEAFDRAFYNDAYRDIAAARLDPVLHYLQGGADEGRDPTPWFSTRRYAAAHREALAGGVNPFFHYLTVGRARGWSPSPDSARDRTRRPLSGAARRAQAAKTAAPPALTRRAVLDTALAGVAAAHVTASQSDYTRTVGGVELCIAREAAALAGRPHLHLHPAVPLPAISDDPNYAVRVLLDGREVGVFAAADLQALAERLAPEGRSTVAVHSLLGHHPETLAPLLAACRPRQSFFWIHDFAAVCDGYTLLYDDKAFCGGPPPGAPLCETCCFGDLRARHLAAHDALFAALRPTLVAPSRTAAEIWSRGRATPVSAILVHPHAAIEPEAPLAPDPLRPVNVGFLGLPLPHKGWPVFCELVDNAVHDARYSFHHFGDTPDLRSRAAFHHVAVSAHHPTAMSDALRLNDIDLAVIWSVCPETFCLTAHEALAAGARLVAYADSGAAAALARAGDNGVVLASAAELVSFFRSGEAIALARRPGRQDGRLRLSGLSRDLIGDAEARP